MKTLLQRGFSHYALLLVLLMGLAACDSSSAVEDENMDQEIAASIAFISSDLEMDASEAAILESAFKSSDANAAHEPGFLWYVAAKLQQNMSDEQKERLLNHLKNRGSVFGRPGFHHGYGPGFDRRFIFRRGFGEFGGFAAAGAFAAHLGLTDDQRAAIAALRDAFKSELEALRASHRDGTISNEEFREALEALGNELKEAWENILTDDQKAILEQMKDDRKAAMEERREQRRANRLAARAVMIEVLGLSDAQVAALEELHEQVEELREAFQELIDSGATREEVKEWAKGANADVTTALIAILDQRQLEIFVIHGALESRAGMMLRRKHHRMHG